jgi:hypothetical protein
MVMPPEEALALADREQWRGLFISRVDGQYQLRRSAGWAWN